VISAYQLPNLRTLFSLCYFEFLVLLIVSGCIYHAQSGL